MNNCEICKIIKEISKNVFEFLENVHDVKEESITDYLVWKWRETDKNFKFININTFTRKEESKLTWADYEMELWLVNELFVIPLVIQAKKFIKDYDNYYNKLKYPNWTNKQLNTLLAYAKCNSRLPFYIFYSIPNDKTELMCEWNYSLKNNALFLADAYKVQNIVSSFSRKPLSKNQILSKTIPFYCLFCCELIMNSYIEFFSKYFSNIISNFDNLNINYNKENLPEYVKLLLNNELTDKRALELIEEYKLNIYRHVAVYDLIDRK